jgi:uncharacterized damage-inducible protein DinB
MIPRVFLEELFHHMEWADAEVWRVVPAEDTRLHTLLHHLHMVQHAFLLVWRGERPFAREAGEFATLADIREWAREFYPAARERLASLDETSLAAPLRLPWADRLVAREGGAAETRFGETMFQVVNHSTYHRGQVNARLRELGVTPPLVDYIAWLWLGRPPARW